MAEQVEIRNMALLSLEKFDITAGRFLPSPQMGAIPAMLGKRNRAVVLMSEAHHVMIRTFSRTTV